MSSRRLQDFFIKTNVCWEKSEDTFILKDKIISKQLKMLHKKLVTTNDKASSNVSFACRTNNAQVLFSELGVNNVDNVVSI